MASHIKILTEVYVHVRHVSKSRCNHLANRHCEMFPVLYLPVTHQERYITTNNYYYLVHKMLNNIWLLEMADSNRQTSTDSTRDWCRFKTSAATTQELYTAVCTKKIKVMMRTKNKKTKVLKTYNNHTLDTKYTMVPVLTTSSSRGHQKYWSNKKMTRGITA